MKTTVENVTSEGGKKLCKDNRSNVILAHIRPMEVREVSRMNNHTEIHNKKITYEGGLLCATTKTTQCRKNK